jgi:hypothetical protein
MPIFLRSKGPERERDSVFVTVIQRLEQGTGDLSWVARQPRVFFAFAW